FGVLDQSRPPGVRRPEDLLRGRLADTSLAYRSVQLRTRCNAQAPRDVGNRLVQHGRDLSEPKLPLIPQETKEVCFLGGCESAMMSMVQETGDHCVVRTQAADVAVDSGQTSQFGSVETPRPDHDLVLVPVPAALLS